MIRGEKVYPRNVRDGDAQRFVDLASEIASRGPYFPLTFQTEASVRASITKDGMWNDDSGTMLVFDAADDRMVGWVLFFRTVRYYRGYEVGYQVFDPKDHGKGFATEATALFCRYLFDAKSILRLTLQIQPGNLASKRVAEKAGFRFEGIARSAFESYGRPVDIEVWSLVHSDVYPPSSQGLPNEQG